jgi:hypothetical protein
VLGILWLVKGGAYLDALSRFALALAVGASAALVLERAPSDWTTPALDRLSIVHVCVLLVGAAIVFGISALTRRTAPDRPRRFVFAALGGAAALAFIASTFPDFLGSPFSGVPLALKALWLDRISEFQPLWPSTPRKLGLLLIYTGISIPALAAIAHQLRYADGDRRDIAALLLIALVVYMPLSLTQIRWSPYVQLLAAAPAGALASRLWTWAWAHAPDRKHGTIAGVAVRIPAAFAVLFTPLVSGALLVAAYTETSEKPLNALTSCPWQDVIPRLRETFPVGEERPILMTFVFAGPELLFRGGYRVVGSTYHTDPGLPVVYDFFEARDTSKAEAIVRERGVAGVVYCKEAPDVGNFMAAPGVSLFKRLNTGAPPAWLKPVALPAKAADAFAAFRVVPAR